ncbi:MAG: hydrogenase maturation protease [Methanobacteriota archaeon]
MSRKAPVPMANDQLAGFLQGASLAVVLGVGSELRGDDAAGILVARRLAESFPARQAGNAGDGSSIGLVALEGHTSPESMAGKIIKLKPSHVLIVDAAEMGLSPGGWGMLGRGELDRTMTSTHRIPLAALAEHLEESCGCKTGFVGVQTGKCGVVVGVSEPVLRAIGEISDKIVQIVSEK